MSIALSKLQALVKEHKTQRATAKHLGMSQQYVSDLLRGKREFSELILAKLGLKKTTIIT